MENNEGNEKTNDKVDLKRIFDFKILENLLQ